MRHFEDPGREKWADVAVGHSIFTENMDELFDLNTTAALTVNIRRSGTVFSG